MMLYSDMKEGIVSKEGYVELHAAYGKRLKNAEESIRAIQKEMAHSFISAELIPTINQGESNAKGTESEKNMWMTMFFA